MNNINNIKNKELITSKDIGTDFSYKHEIVWKNVVVFAILHCLGIWGIKILVTGGVSWKTFAWATVLMICLGQGITSGAHRLFAHRSYKARTPLKLYLTLMQTGSGQNSIYIWVRDHRLHHRYSDTDADPHNSNRGFFFSHIGWLMAKKHPYVKEFGKNIDMSDLKADSMVMFQKKYYWYLYGLIAFFIPVIVPWYMGETFKNSLLVCYFARYILQLNGTWLVNSAAHLYGTRPYDKNIQPVESWFVSLLAFGEGWHNYHHTFPWDYKAAELTQFLNLSAKFIELWEKWGLAYDLKSASPEMVAKRILKVGDGTHYYLGNDEDKLGVTAIGPLHPLNPTYNVTYPAPNTILSEAGLIFNQ
ncbi:stearoyl-CoA desaturase 4-like [Pieris napi]|uniref:stearoyl-CoA desaturase 4-like n=1 Tax=Pieris napi TaxID=78633 RepID=UPI001FBA96D6|nr:stearoyl-CoA desaturase 4-like [Pieris napi]